MIYIHHYTVYTHTDVSIPIMHTPSTGTVTRQVYQDPHYLTIALINYPHILTQIKMSHS